MHYYLLTTAGHYTLHSRTRLRQPGRWYRKSLLPFWRAMAVADVIVHTLVAAQVAHMRGCQVHCDGHLKLQAGEYRQEPDCHFPFESGGWLFNLVFEIDNSTEPLDSNREHSIKTKLLGYEAYQDFTDVLRVRGMEVGPYRVLRGSSAVLMIRHIGPRLS